MLPCSIMADIFLEILSKVMKILPNNIFGADRNLDMGNQIKR